MIMQGLKGIVIAAVLVTTAVSLGACRKEVGGEPLKLGASDVTVAVVR
jgi:hypothetical protein